MFICTLLFLVSTNYTFEFGIFHLMIFQFTLFCYATAFWALGYIYAINKGNTLFFIFIAMSIFYSYYKKLPGVDKLMEIVLYSGYTFIIYAVFFIGVGRIASMNADSSRYVSGLANLNTVGMLAATTILINFYYFLEGKFRRLFLLAIPALSIIAVSQSRKAIFMLVIGTLLLYLLKNLRMKKDNLLPVLRFFFFLMLVIAAFAFLAQTDMFAGTMNRLDGLIASLTGEGSVDSSTSKREFMRQVGWIQFSRTPLLGIGIGCARIQLNKAMDIDGYLHCNYAELAADGGIVGLISYYIMFLYVLFKEFKYFKVDNMAFLMVTLIFIRLVTDWGMVSYYNKSTYFWLMIYYLHLRSCQIKYPHIK